MRRFAAAVALAAMASAASASIVLRVTPRELADAAGLVVEGRVASIDVRWDEGRTCICTYATVSVERVLKGAATGSVTVKVPGGRVGDEEVRVEGTAKFEKDEEVVVFLWKDGAGDWIVLGEAQGKFRTWQDAKAGRRMAANSLKGLCLVVRGGSKGAAAETARKPDSLPYDDLAAVVKASVEAARAALAPAPAGRDPAPPTATPDPPSTTKPPGAEAPPPAKDVPAPKAGSSDTPGAGQPPPPAPEKK